MPHHNSPTLTCRGQTELYFWISAWSDMRVMREPSSSSGMESSQMNVFSVVWGTCGVLQLRWLKATKERNTEAGTHSSVTTHSCPWRESHTGSKRGIGVIKHKQGGRNGLAGPQGCQCSSRCSHPSTCSGSGAILKQGTGVFLFLLELGAQLFTEIRAACTHHAESSCCQTVWETRF